MQPCSWSDLRVWSLAVQGLTSQIGLLERLQSTGAIANLIKGFLDNPEETKHVSPEQLGQLQHLAEADTTPLPIWARVASKTKAVCNLAQLLGLPFSADDKVSPCMY